jgi:hypothetical protein
VALILAVNPGSRHNPTLSRLARELQGCEIMGAESCSVALGAIRKRVPDVLLLPAIPAQGQADLLAQLKLVPGGVLTLTLPPVESADPAALARQIREMLTGMPAFSPTPSVRPNAPMPGGASGPADTSRHLVAAAKAAIAWAHTRRAEWSSDRHLPEEHLERALASEPRHEEPTASPEAEPTREPDDTDADDRSATGTSWLPRAAALAVAIGLVAAAASCWPQLRGIFVSAAAPIRVAGDPAPSADTQAPSALLPAAVRAETTTPARTSEPTITITATEPPHVLHDGARAGYTPYAGKLDATTRPPQLEVDLSQP